MADGPARRDDTVAPRDPTADAWSGWLPDLDALDATTASTRPDATRPLPQDVTTPLPAASATPAPTTAPTPSVPAAPVPVPPAPVPQPPLPQASGPGRPYEAPRPLPPPPTGPPGPSGIPAAPSVAPGPPPSHLALAIVLLVLFPIPFGIVAVIRAASVSGHWNAGRYAEAQRASRSARRWGGFGLGSLLAVYVVLGVVSVFMSAVMGMSGG